MKDPIRLTHLPILLTKRCNLKCPHCLRGDAAKDDIDIGVLRRTLEKFMPLGLIRVCFSGGEPGMHPRFHEIVKMAYEEFNLDVGIVTNATRPDLYVDSLDYLSSIQVSLDGLETHNDMLRGRGSYTKAVENIREYVKTHLVHINSVFSKSKIPTLEEELREMISVIPDANSYSVSIIHEGTGDPLTTDDRREVVRILLKLVDEDHFPVVPHHAVIGSIHDAVDFTKGVEKKWDKHFCPKLEVVYNKNPFEAALTSRELPTVIHTGEIIFCCETLGDGARIAGPDDSAETINQNMRDAVSNLEQWRARNMPDISDCRSCHAWIESKEAPDLVTIGATRVATTF